jgi:hypothetical protein
MPFPEEEEEEEEGGGEGGGEGGRRGALPVGHSTLDRNEVHVICLRVVFGAPVPFFVCECCPGPPSPATTAQQEQRNNHDIPSRPR